MQGDISSVERTMYAFFELFHCGDPCFYEHLVGIPLGTEKIGEIAFEASISPLTIRGNVNYNIKLTDGLFVLWS